MAAPLLEVQSLRATYGAVVALDDVSFTLERGELMLVVGPNGAGKSTLIRVLMGLHPPAAGTVDLDGEDISSSRAHVRARSGLVMVAEGRGIVPELSVKENLDLAKFSGRWTPEAREHSYDRFPVLNGSQNRRAGTLSGGEQQMLAIARAIEASPHLLLVDEPSLGLAPKIVDEVMNLLKDLADEGHSILLVEQRAAQVQQIASRIFLMRQGRLSDAVDRVEFAEMSFADFAGAER